MAKAELGTKRVCPETGRKFYDLGKTPVISPYTGKVVPVETPTARSRAEPAPTPAPRPAAAVAPVPAEEIALPEPAEAEFVSLEEADAEAEGKKLPEGEVADGADEEIEIEDEQLDDAAFIEEQEEGDEDVADIIGDVDNEEEP